MPLPSPAWVGVSACKEQSHSATVQSFGFAGKHRPCGFKFAAFWLLDHTCIKPAENPLPLRFEPLHLFAGFLKQKALHVQSAACEGADQLAHPLGACGCGL